MPRAELGATKAAEAANGPAPATPRTIPTVPVESVTRDGSLSLTGSLLADEESDVASKADGVVQQVFVERGSIVEEGDTLVQIDPTDIRNLLEQGLAGLNELRARLGMEEGKAYKTEDQPEVRSARASLELASLTLKRRTDLVKQGILSKADLDQAQTEYDAANQRYLLAVNQANQLYRSYETFVTKIKIAKKALDDTTVKAPFSGLIVKRNVSVGERVTTNPMGEGSKVVTLVRIDPLRLALTVPQQFAGEIKTGLPVEFKVDGFGDRTFKGEVRYVTPSLDANNRSLMVEAVVPNQDKTLRPGLFATGAIMLPEKTQAILVPATAVIRQEDTATVYVVRDGVARAQVASLGATEGDKVVVVSGLAAGDVVVTAPQGIHDGDKVD